MNKKSPVFSVVITAFNQENCISNTVDSVLSQSFKDLELVIVDDCSSDNTPEILRKIAESDSRVKLILHKENKSTFITRLDGIRNTNGDFILFLDGDDAFFPDALQTLYEEVIQKEDFDACEFSYFETEENRTVKPNPDTICTPVINVYSRMKPCVSFCNKLYKASLLQNAFNDVPEAYMNVAEDWYMSICAAFFAKKLIQKDILVYRYNTGRGITSKKYSFENNRKNFLSIKKVIECIELFLKKNNVDKNLASSIVQNMENGLYDWAKVKIKYQTEEKDIIKSYLLLPQTFSEETLEKDFSQLFLDAKKYQDGKFSLYNYLRKLYHGLKEKFR